jgi:hypothetical protein
MATNWSTPVLVEHQCRRCWRRWRHRRQYRNCHSLQDIVKRVDVEVQRTQRDVVVPTRH